MTTPTDLPLPDVATRAPRASETATAVLAALSLSHLLNDTIQSILPAVYPMLHAKFDLTFGQVGEIGFTTQVTSSLLQPIVGVMADRRPRPFSLAFGMFVSMVGLLLLATADSFGVLILAAGIVGFGSAVFHPEASRMAYLAAGGRHGFAQSLFQVGGNFGTSLGPLLAAGIIIRRGQGSVAWFAILAVVGMVVLARVGVWYRDNLHRAKPKPRVAKPGDVPLSRGRVAFALAILVALVFSKYVYLVSLTSYYQFYLIQHFGVSQERAPLYLFAFLFAVAAGTFAGGPIGDRVGRKPILWFSILGVAPFSLILPHVGLAGTVVCSIFAGFVLASAFSAIIVFAQQLVPGKVGMIAGLFYGLAFGISGVAAAAMGGLADRHGIEFVFKLCAFLPLIGVLVALLPNVDRPRITTDAALATTPEP